MNRSYYQKKKKVDHRWARELGPKYIVGPISGIKIWARVSYWASSPFHTVQWAAVVKEKTGNPIIRKNWTGPKTGSLGAPFEIWTGFKF